MPTYFDRLLDTIDLRAAYRHHKLELQLLQWRGAPRRWALKWPCHLVALDEMLDVYPDARFVVTHRDPVQALASNCSSHVPPTVTQGVDRREIGRQMKDMILRYVERLVPSTGVTRSGRLVRRRLPTVVDEPDGDDRGVRALGLELTPAVREMRSGVASREPAREAGVHDYASASTASTPREVRRSTRSTSTGSRCPTEGGATA